MNEYVSPALGPAFKLEPHLAQVFLAYAAYYYIAARTHVAFDHIISTLV